MSHIACHDNTENLNTLSLAMMMMALSARVILAISLSEVLKRPTACLWVVVHCLVFGFNVMVID